MFSPLRRITFFQRSTKYKFCSASRHTTSPVWNQPPSQAVSVASASSEIFAEEAGAWFGPGSAHQQFAERAIGCIDTRLIDDAALHEGLRPAEAGPADMPRFVARDHHRAGAGFGHGPGVDHRDAEALFERGVVARIDAGAKPNRT